MADVAMESDGKAAVGRVVQRWLCIFVMWDFAVPPNKKCGIFQ